ncbi:hypothetical protein QYE76_031688 [Lolium multiflorum]|uniref:Transposase (putative) gypsy type domain-containing protein n=1 Tax=Lolium multiflorum TaxID=4521 RepID=A0AAD8VKE6_LOLMU|nr:hypothetical protein QYE76_031688 [Lolium multiflorum]
MGKKKGFGEAGSASGLSKAIRDWCASTISNRDVNRLCTLGFISSSVNDIHLPSPSSRPKPPKGFTVMFAAFLFRGLSLPAHEFLPSLPFVYGIQLWQLTPISILHLSIFITLCEAFLGIDPHWGLWRKIFYVKHHNGSDTPPPPVVGGVGFVVRKEVGYLNYPMKDSDDDDEVPLAKRVKLFSEKAELAKESNPSTADPTPPSRTGVVKIPVSKVIPSASTPIPPAARDHLRKTIKTSVDQVLEANELTADAQNENILLKDELKKLKKKMKDEEDARREAAIVADEKEGVLRESITNLLNSFDFFPCRFFFKFFG